MSDHHRRVRAAGALLWALVASGCAAPQTAALLRETPNDIAPRAEVTNTPFFPQEQYQCGPAALATALVRAGRETDPEALAPQLYVPDREGSLQVEMAAAARRHGALAYPLAPRLADLLAEVDAGHPVVVLQNLGLDWAPAWHYAVVVGYDLPEGIVVLRSGAERRRRVALTTFERTWARAERWALLVLPPDTLPARPARTTYLRAAVALERTAGPAAARPAYAAALRRWPQSLGAAIGLGNCHYALGELDAAADAYARAARSHPDAAAAFNNLAQARADQGRHSDALAAARRALQLAPDNRLYRRTMAELRAATARAP